MSKKPTQTDLTGRDGYIIHQALLYAIAAIQNLPAEDQEWSNMRDMCIIARTRANPAFIPLIGSVLSHVDKTFTLWPEPEAELSKQEREDRDRFERACRDWAGASKMMEAGDVDSVGIDTEWNVSCVIERDDLDDTTYYEVRSKLYSEDHPIVTVTRRMGDEWLTKQTQLGALPAKRLARQLAAELSR